MGRKHDKKEEASIILEILNRIPLSKRFVSVDDILNSLASADIDVSRRSLQRYLKQMYDCGKYGLCATTEEMPTVTEENARIPSPTIFT